MFNRCCTIIVAACLSCGPAHGAARLSQPHSAIASKVKAEVAEIIGGINSKDIAEATRYDASDLVSMESMRAPSFGAKADRDGLSMAFKYTPSWHLTLVDETVDVAKAGDMAVYRGTYDEDSLRDGVPFTHRGDYLAGFRRDADGMWRVHWSVVSWQSASKKKG
jgi:ketosteroid isomerase-like protein